jgi:deoxyribodipyrimidine photo-lyase
MHFPTELEAVYQRIDQFDPVRYAQSRNFISGGVSYLSPYLSRGFISIPFVIDRLQKRGFEIADMEKFVQELAWREFYTRTWFKMGDDIFKDIGHPQENVYYRGIPAAILQSKTGIHALDKHLSTFPNTGYLHNHLRMYIASISCNIGKYHWQDVSKWMYYHLLDGDLASNALSWQWCAGTFSNKLYFVNQENINKYTRSNQTGTFLDVDYEALPNMPVPDVLKSSEEIEWVFEPPISKMPIIDPDLPTFIYTHYTLDPLFHASEEGNRILILEPAHFHKHPISPKSLQFILDLAKNIPNLQVYYGAYADLGLKGIFQDHPINSHFDGHWEPYPYLREGIDGNYPSFFSFWNKLKPLL